MMNDAVPLLFLACCAALIILPLWVGIKLIGEAQRGRDSLYLMAGLFTLKPMLATPLWAALYGIRGRPSLFTVFLSILPAVLITTALVLIFRKVFAGPHRSKAWGLLALDWVRWGSTLLMMLSSLTESELALVFMIASLLMPSLYAIVAYRITSKVIEYPASDKAKMQSIARNSDY
jgi:hypothetical protein